MMVKGWVNYDETFVGRAIERALNFLRSDFNLPEHMPLTPWELVQAIPKLELTASAARTTRPHTSSEARIAEDAIVSDLAVVRGPVVIGPGARVEPFATLVGPLYVGKGATIGNYSLVRGSVLGDDVTIGAHVELARSVVLNRSKVAHKNIVADSIIGSQCWLAGNVNIANSRMDGKQVRAHIGSHRFNAGRKYGATIEDGCNIPAHVLICEGSYVTTTLSLMPCDVIFGVSVLRTIDWNLRHHRNRRS